MQCPLKFWDFLARALLAFPQSFQRLGCRVGKGPLALTRCQLDPATSMDLAALQRLSDIVDLVASSFQATSAMAVSDPKMTSFTKVHNSQHVLQKDLDVRQQKKILMSFRLILSRIPAVPQLVNGFEVAHL